MVGLKLGPTTLLTKDDANPNQALCGAQAQPDVTLFMWDRKCMVHIILDRLVVIDIQLHGLQTGCKPCALW